MGTYFTKDATKQDIVDDILNDLKTTPYHPFECWNYETQQAINPPIELTGKSQRRLDHALRGNNLWVLFEIVETVRMCPPTREVTVLLYKLECHRGDWGYKPMDESMGPYEYNVPQSWAKRVTAPSSEYARVWRERAFGMAYAAKQFEKELDFGGAFDGFNVTSDADGGL